MNRIYIANEQSKIEVNRRLCGLIRRAIGAALKYEKFAYDAEISVTLTDNDKIRALNSEYRNIDRATDVLSFPLLEKEEVDAPDESEEEPICLGDIVVSLERANAQSEEYGHSFEREVAFLCVHSVLHLLGYDHELGKEQEEDMFARQEEILKKIKLTRD